MLEPDWNSIDLDTVNAAVRDYITRRLDPDGQIIAHQQRDDAHLTIAKTSPTSMWGLMAVSTTTGSRELEFVPQLLDLTAEHTITHGSVAEAKGRRPLVHYLAIRAPGVISARARLAPEDWETLAPIQGWLLDIRAVRHFDAVPEYEYLDPQLGWSNL